jgi:GntR family transcriptional regulator, rspAB operon transcriptional repressor
MTQPSTIRRSRSIKKAAPKKRLSLRDLAYEAIKRQIVACDLKPGEALTVNDLANALDLGRTPVFQAIDRLTIEGLVHVMPRKGIVVSPISLDDFIAIIEMRLINETQAARWASERASNVEIRQIEGNLDAIWVAAKRGNISDFIDLDREFHRLIARASRNGFLSEFLGGLHDKSLRFWFISLRAPEHNIRVCEQHAAILEGIRNRDPSAAEKAMRRHISSFRANATREIVGSDQISPRK